MRVFKFNIFQYILTILCVTVLHLFVVVTVFRKNRFKRPDPAGAVWFQESVSNRTDFSWGPAKAF